MSIKQVMVIPIYWGEWWIPANNHAYAWPEMNGLMSKVITGRYMDGLNQYGLGRGAVTPSYVYDVDPPPDGFWDQGMQWLFKMAIDHGHVPAPDNFDDNTQIPFYTILVKPGVEHRRDAAVGVPNGTPDINTGAYHFGFSYNYVNTDKSWSGQACWVKSCPDAVGTLQRWVHEMAEAYSGHGEIADKCQNSPSILVDGVSVPTYWSVEHNRCWPLSDDEVAAWEKRKIHFHMG